MDDMVTLLLSKNEGYTERNLTYPKQSNFGIPIGQGDHDYCRMPSQGPQTCKLPVEDG